MKKIFPYISLFFICFISVGSSTENKSIKVVIAESDKLKFNNKILPFKFSLLNDDSELKIIVKNISTDNLAILKYSFASSVRYFDKKGKETPGYASVIAAINIPALDHMILMTGKSHTLAIINLPDDKESKLNYDGSFGFLDPQSGEYIKYSLSFQWKENGQKKEITRRRADRETDPD